MEKIAKQLEKIAKQFIASKIIKIENFLEQNIDVDTSDGVYQDHFIGYVGPTILTEEGKEKFKSILNKQISVSDDYAEAINLSEREANLFWQLLTCAAGYCSQSVYNKYFQDQEQNDKNVKDFIEEKKRQYTMDYIGEILYKSFFKQNPQAKDINKDDIIIEKVENSKRKLYNLFCHYLAKHFDDINYFKFDKEFSHDQQIYIKCQIYDYCQNIVIRNFKNIAYKYFNLDLNDLQK